MLTSDQQERYARHLILEGVGPEGQEKLLNGKVLVIGAGGLGSPAAFYLAAAGVGTIGIADSDRIELSNLQRQIIHSTAGIGRLKVESAREAMCELNPDVQVRTYPVRVDDAILPTILADYDFVIDATDNFASKFLINDACVRAGKSFSHGGILRYAGQTMTVHPHRSACYRCLFEEEPSSEIATSCSRAGVMGVLPGVIGSLQATEALKHVMGVGELLTGRMLTYDSLALRFREVAVGRRRGCGACGQ
ncbi:molybdopterin-synthase adenylyltransferase MoeB [Geobacter sulfurreducens]|jgi:molybdopterin/thiamine biosynthesis adenylyltransferase|uniref:Molybdopterin-synthase adenylyltransferase n=2 Tax=Geobacter sulfurreducens TaxID=35554 RepID=Q74FF5_GEOSL|nr:molybdopterin-synthase adenylyltransferase MoeB [Geobacter sulfurreducens]AAR33984.1 thiamin biosynthesis thiocarboxylate synthase [Geobacter sulfurreducens PCA]ADI83493.1 thiamin biosynthesis thiocarboxylate synthase [Geobacter sulfurreducens KN400]AJY70402.1 adenylyltransferase [Geobacter sulfurreducens]QVW35893.1 molybdopterin-synthase adenylyltransferase MoeB [Geobacter sulfurreducens]UAC04718.1 molybdopterin-synthase adenylyltransferase MoeB [Geobacter sulfurreducens]